MQQQLRRLAALVGELLQPLPAAGKDLDGRRLAGIGKFVSDDRLVSHAPFELARIAGPRAEHGDEDQRRARQQHGGGDDDGEERWTHESGSPVEFIILHRMATPPICKKTDAIRNMRPEGSAHMPV